jgi:hypothetical protein
MAAFEEPTKITGFWLTAPLSEADTDNCINGLVHHQPWLLNLI